LPDFICNPIPASRLSDQWLVGWTNEFTDLICGLPIVNDQTQNTVDDCAETKDCLPVPGLIQARDSGMEEEEDFDSSSNCNHSME
jgi:hypothetical protein